MKSRAYKCAVITTSSPMKIKYNAGFHGYDNAGFPIITDEAGAAQFKTKSDALTQVAHDGDQFGFWNGGFQVI